MGESEFDEENLDEIEDILSVCCGLVIIDPETQAVRLVHYKTQQYFDQMGSQHFPNAQEDIAVSCLTYLLFNEFGDGWIWHEGDRLQRYPFLRYAARFWIRHAEEYICRFEDRVGKLVVDLLTDSHKVPSAGQIVTRSSNSFLGTAYAVDSYHFSELYFKGLSPPSPKAISGMHLATFFNSSDLMSKLLELELFAADVKDQADRTPLIWAANQGHESAVRVLLHRQDVDVNTIAKHEISGRWRPITALACAARQGHAKTIELLLERDDINVNLVNKSEDNLTPLMWAAKEGNEAALMVLLKHQDIVADYQGSADWTALSLAAAEGHTGCVQLSAERSDVEVDRRNSCGRTPLANAVENGCLEVVKLLLAYDVDVNSKNYWGETMLEVLVRSENVYRHSEMEFPAEIVELMEAAIHTRSWKC